MKTCTTHAPILRLAAALLAFPLGARAATQTYDDANGANVWDASTSNWDGSIAPWTNGNDAVFGGTGEAVAISPVTVQNLTINSAGYSFTGGLLTFAGTTPTVTAAQDVALAATVTGSAGLVKTGAGVLTVSESGSITGGITVNQGTLRMNQSGHPFNTATGWNGGAVTVNAGGTVVLAGDFNAGYGRAFTINGGTLNATAGAAADSNNYLNNLALQNGASVTGNALRLGYHSNATVTVGGTSASTISGRLLLVNGGGFSATFNVADATSSSANDLTVSGIISDYTGLGGTPVIKSGAGTLVLSGANSYGGVTTVNAGTLKIGHMNALGAFQGGRPVTQVVVNSGGAIDFNGVNDATYGYTIAGTGVGGTGALVNSGAGIGNGIAQTSNIKLSANATVGGTGNWALLTNGYGATSLDLNGLTMTKAGAGTVTLANTTTTAGTVMLSAGGLQLGVPGNAGTAVNGAASAFEVNGGTLTAYINSSLGSLTGTGGSVNVDVGRTLTVGALNTSPAAFAGSVTLGSGATLSKTGTGTLHLTGAGSGPATVSVGAGTFRVAGTRGFNEGFFANNDSVNYTVAAGATLEVAAIYNTRSNNAVTLNGGTLHFSTAGSDNYLNTINFNTGTSTITSVGGFRGGYFYSPTTTVNAAASGSTISSALVFVNNGTPTWTFNVDNGVQASDLTVSGVMQDLPGWSGMGVVKSGSGTLTLSGNNTYAGATAVNAGTLLVHGNHSGNGLITVSAGATLGGNGSVGAVTVADNGVLAPGAGAGHFRTADLTLNPLSMLNFELAAPTLVQSPASDFVTITGTLTLGGTLNITALPGFGTPAGGEKWLIMAYSGGIADNGIVIGTAPALDPGLSFAVDSSTTGQVFLTVVPEAGTGALVFLGLAILARRRG